LGYRSRAHFLRNRGWALPSACPLGHAAISTVAAALTHIWALESFGSFWSPIALGFLREGRRGQARHSGREEKRGQ
jgi:hypothetical protein